MAKKKTNEAKNFKKGYESVFDEIDFLFKNIGKEVIEMETKKIFKRAIALELIASKKHNFLYTEPNRNKTGFSVFIFEKTPELLTDLTKLTQHN
ncbi:hypothetical protein HBE96_23115 [Clostridium sp. P21]|uniref:Uncharacterized protein n=1 Tax=Clostridium muellerianum TaxID=2716538 RepID=A0A7Y0ELS6_9CLOT|nr:hypothetical protein [Clostridium muellerianum]NMM65472.1 hypothetical protein [Clostridium muellerianum]